VRGGVSARRRDRGPCPGEIKLLDQERGLIMKTVEELDVFKLSHSLALEIFETTNSFPEEEKFGLIS